MANPPYNLDISDPTNPSAASIFPANERAFRDNVQSYLGVEHDINTGFHKFQELTTAQIGTLTTPPHGMVVFNTDLGGLQVNTGSSGSPVWVLVYNPLVTHTVFTNNGTFTILATSTKITIVGGGGGGGGGSATLGGGGGGGGALSESIFNGLTVGNTLTVTVGNGGGGGAPTVAGVAGGLSSVASGTQVIVTLQAGGGAGGGPGAASTGGNGGSANGTIQANGGNGGAGSGSTGGGHAGFNGRFGTFGSGGDGGAATVGGINGSPGIVVFEYVK